MTRSGPVLALSCLMASTPAFAQAQGDRPAPSRTAVERMSDPGPEAKELAARAGLWDVVFTLRPAPGAEPVITRGLVAERTMVGPFLQEVMRPRPDPRSRTSGGSTT